MNIIPSAVPTGLFFSSDALYPSNELLGYSQLPLRGFS